MGKAQKTISACGCPRRINYNPRLKIKIVFTEGSIEVDFEFFIYHG